MKGQYLAVESVLTVGMGITLAAATVTLFDMYQENIEGSTIDKQVEEIEYKTKTAVYNLKGADSGSIEMDLPEDVGGADYNLVLDENIKILTVEDEYVSNLKGITDDTQGSVTGGTVVLYKSGDQYTLRSN